MQSIQFTSPNKVDVIDIPELVPDEKPVIRNICSIISPGTELAILNGTESWAQLPYIPGYGSVGVISEPGDSGLERDTRVFTYGRHGSQTYGETLYLPVPEGLPSEEAVFARIAAVSITAIRCSSLVLGNRVAVVGAGLVGNVAAQLARISGGFVTIFDKNPSRLDRAKECGIDGIHVPDGESLQSVGPEDPDEKFDVVVEATGIPGIIEEAFGLVGKKGELILLGSPRGTHTTDITPLLNKIHLCPENVTVKGAHEWQVPVEKDPDKRYAYSLEGNVGDLFGLMSDGRLSIKPLTTHFTKPEGAQSLYDGLRTSQDEYLGVVFDWR